jgi:hypothetical protein
LWPVEALEEQMSYLAASPNIDSFLMSIASSPSIGFI